MNSPKPSLAYRPDVDGLRAVAVVAVLLFHIWPGLFPGGFLGVDVFFVISGYLITRIVAGQIRTGTFSFASFYARRVRRLLPALLVMLVVVMVVGWLLLLPSDYLATSRAAVATTLISSNFVFWRVLQEGYFAPDAKLNPLLHTWSLGVEEQFYLLYPLLLYLCARRAPSMLRPCVAIGIAVSLGASIALVERHSVAVFFLAPFRAWELLAGAALAVGLVPPTQGKIPRAVISALGLAAIAAGVIFYEEISAVPAVTGLLPVAGAAAAIHTGGPDGLFKTSILSSRPLVYLGLISYSLYLWHWPIVVFTKYAFSVDVGFWLGCALVATSLGVAALSHRFIEEPFRSGRHGRKFGIPAGVFACSTVVAIIALAGVYSGGFKNRVSHEALAYDDQRRSIVPFKKCDANPTWCVIGDGRVKPTILFWGDSHMLAWAPAVDQELRRSGRSAFFAIYAACPPLWGVAASSHPGCEPANRRVEDFLAAGNGIQRVVMSANWNLYLQAHRLRRTYGDVSGGDPSELLATAFDMTVGAIRGKGMTVAVLGSVPTFAREVPLALAMKQDSLGFSEALQPTVDRFGVTLKMLTLKHGGVYLDVRRAMCSSSHCEVERNGRSNYRDGDHLSVSGALAFSDMVRESIELAGHEVTPEAMAQGRTISDGSGRM